MNKHDQKRTREKVVLFRLSAEGQDNRKKMIRVKVKNAEKRIRLASKLARERATQVVVQI